MSMWEPRSSHLYVGPCRGIACRLWLLCCLCVHGSGAHAAPLWPPWFGGGVCVCVYSLCPFAPPFVCVCSWFCVCRGVGARAVACAAGVSGIHTRVYPWGIRVLGKGTSVFARVFVCVFIALRRIRGVAQRSLGAHLQEHRGPVQLLFPPEPLVPKPHAGCPPKMCWVRGCPLRETAQVCVAEPEMEGASCTQ